MKKQNELDETTRRFNSLAVELQQMFVESHLSGFTDNDTEGTATAILYSIFRQHDPKIVFGMRADHSHYCRVHYSSTAVIKEAIKERAGDIANAISLTQNN